jgi:hypothetical protein
MYRSLSAAVKANLWLILTFFVATKAWTDESLLEWMRSERRSKLSQNKIQNGQAQYSATVAKKGDFFDGENESYCEISRSRGGRAVAG